MPHPILRCKGALGRRYGLRPPPADASRLGRLAWLLALLTPSLETAARGHPEWHVARHEELCAFPADRFRELATRLELTWSATTEAALEATKRPASGHAINRVASSLPDVWESRLGVGQVAEIAEIVTKFPLESSDLSRVALRLSARSPRGYLAEFFLDAITEFAHR